MRTHIELDDAALAEHAKLLKRRRLVQLRGKIRWDADIDQVRATRPGLDLPSDPASDTSNRD